jgi:hypothetical protein
MSSSGAKWDRLLDDIEARQDELRRIEPGTQRVWLAAMTAGAALFAAGGVIGGLIVHLGR